MSRGKCGRLKNSIGPELCRPRCETSNRYETDTITVFKKPTDTTKYSNKCCYVMPPGIATRKASIQVEGSKLRALSNLHDYSTPWCLQLPPTVNVLCSGRQLTGAEKP